MEKVEYRRSTKGEIFRYAFGGLGSNIPFFLVLSYLMFFYTDVVQISPAAIGTLFFITRFIDAVTDPLMGMIADRTRTKLGQYRPWLLFGGPVLGLSVVALFWVPDLSPDMKLVYIYVTYIAYSVISTVVNIPYHSLTPVLSEDPDQRTWLATAKQFMGTPANFLARVLVLPLVALAGGGEQGWLITAVLFAIVVVISFYICASSAKRHDVVDCSEEASRNRPKFSLGKQLALVGTNVPLLMLMVSLCTNLIATSTQSAVAIYYWTYNVGREDLFPIVGMVGILLSVPTFFLLPYLSKRFGKKTVFVYGSIASILPFGIILFSSYDMVGLNFSAAVLIAVLSPFTGAIAWAMLPDCVDYGEWKTGIRGAGVISSSLTFINKLGSAIGGMLGGALLAATGYVAGQAQSAETLRMIVYLFALIPILGHIATVIALKFYKIDNVYHAKMLKEIKERKDNQAIS
ncbi:glycoside-pentoside-hexuronide (GPH):cation symporter [Gracilibacillus sp. S3-1-1]|uniref:Glycoside-pentoside-hexuronide (GPH):cation symporter n=1 Tax=Gracilibacillus pellucidus TaxID=3095368 RepID=A0ACC6M368_9BACI|nr:glycoside-pentoside-hexuronide (GPH):cation symporter [Gracilibacillus sp. S3-1-1]MDX8045396.1 glycoside-pentoside-hexuronide (GPH):cation symporter [Gracilibacillus sp. S3-1-1]